MQGNNNTLKKLTKGLENIISGVNVAKNSAEDLVEILNILLKENEELKKQIQDLEEKLKKSENGLETKLKKDEKGLETNAK